MDLNFFKKIRVLDAGMGQELLARGLITKGTLWSASSLLEEKYNKLVIDTHLSSINAGAEVILTNTFTTRRVRMEQNQVGDLFQLSLLLFCQPGKYHFGQEDYLQLKYFFLIFFLLQQQVHMLFGWQI